MLSIALAGVAASVAKDKARDKERLAHQTAYVERDTARLELNRKLATHRSKQSQVKHQIDEIDKLNSIINNMEREMLSLKKKYEVAVERRNFAGIQLIDRNDELCILYEKSNVHELTMSKGNVSGVPLRGGGAAPVVLTRLDPAPP